MTPQTGTAEVVEETTGEEVSEDSAWKTVLYNCECHTFDDVEKQLIKATRCSLSKARQLSNEVHQKGLAVVYTGAKERCEAVAMVLGEIGLIVSVAK